MAVTNSPRYRDAASKILEYVHSNALGVDTRLPSEREFCQIIQTSQPTINKAITSLIAEGHLRREGRKLYVAAPRTVAENLPAIPILCPHAEYQRHAVIRHDLIEAAHDVAANLQTQTMPLLARSPTEQRQQLLQLLRTNTPGFVIWPRPFATVNDLFEQFTERKIPFVVCDVDLENYDFVGIDNEYGSMLAVRHLHALGHRQIAFFSNTFADPNLKRRYQGYQYACFTLDMQSSMRRVIQLPNIETAAIETGLTKLLADWPEVTAIYFSSDVVALQAIETLKTRGIYVPEDLSVIGFDGIDASQISQPALTTISQDFYQMGVMAVERLFSRLRGSVTVASSRPWRLRVEPTRLVRDSTGMPRSKRK